MCILEPIMIMKISTHSFYKNKQHNVMMSDDNFLAFNDQGGLA